MVKKEEVKKEAKKEAKKIAKKEAKKVAQHNAGKGASSMVQAREKAAKKAQKLARKALREQKKAQAIKGSGAYTQNLAKGRSGNVTGSGGYFSDMLGGIGKTIGGIGDGVAGIITGSGDYSDLNNFGTVKTNSLFDRASGGIKFKTRHLSKADAAVGNKILQGEQRIGYIVGSDTFQLTEHRIFLGNQEIFPIDFLENDKFQEYKWHGAILEIRSLANQLSTVITDGQIYAAPVYNVEEAKFVTIEQMSNAFGKAGGKILNSYLIGLECASNETNSPVKKTINDNTVITNDNWNEYNLCNFTYAVTGLPAEAVGKNIAELIIHYDIDLLKKIQPMNYLQCDTLECKFAGNPSTGQIFAQPNGIAYEGGDPATDCSNHYSTSPLKLVKFDATANSIQFNYPGRYLYKYNLYGLANVSPSATNVGSMELKGLDSGPIPEGCCFVDDDINGILNSAYLTDIGSPYPNPWRISAGLYTTSSTGLSMYTAETVIDVTPELCVLYHHGPTTAWDALGGGLGPLVVIKVIKLPSSTPTLDGLPEVDNSSLSLKQTTHDVRTMKKEFDEMKAFINSLKKPKKVIRNNNETIQDVVDRLNSEENKSIHDTSRIISEAVNKPRLQTSSCINCQVEIQTLNGLPGLCDNCSELDSEPEYNKVDNSTKIPLNYRKMPNRVSGKRASSTK